MPNIYQSLAYQAERHPDAIAVIEGRETYTFSAFVDYVQRHAACLDSMEIQKGDRVFVVADNSARLLALYHATALNGFILVPVNVRLSPAELAWMISHCRPKLVLFDEKNRKLADAARAITVEKPRWEQIDLLPVDTAVPSMDHLTARYGSVDDQDIGLIIYTSGTTSRPKGAMLRHSNLAWNAINYQVELGINHTCRAILTAPLFHIAGYGVISGPILLAGGCVSMMSRFDAEAIIGHLEEFHPTHLFLLSAMWVTLTDHPRFASLRFPGVSYVQTAAAPLAEHRQDIIRTVFPNADFGWGFGMTESCVTTFKNKTTQEIRDHPGSVGYRWPNIEFRLVDEKGDTIIDERNPGELQVKGPTVFAGYWEDPEATAATILPGGWLRTGDLIRFDEDGFAYFVGRAKDMIKTGGENVAALEVEIALLEHPSVSEAAVYGVQHEVWGEAVQAVVVLREGLEASPSELLGFCREKLASFKVPKALRIVDELPKSSSGKIQKFRLKEMAQ